MSAADPTLVKPALSLHLITHGCEMNKYDSQKIEDVLSEAYTITSVKDPQDADILVLNTCSVREKAQENVFSQIGRWRKAHEKKGTTPIVAIGGCVASQEGANIQKRAPFVNIVFGPQTLHRLPAMVESVRTKETKRALDISFPEIEKFDRLPTPKADGPKAYVSIMEGCSKYCTFCVVPYTRGEEISRPVDSVLAEVALLTQQGVREIHLLGQNVNDYRGLTHDGEVADLALLIHFIVALPPVARVRFTTSHPMAFGQNLIDVFAEEPKLVNHLHLPVQSGSDRILALMKRQYTCLEYKSKIRALRKVRPTISLSSDFIIGFPGETEEDFRATMSLIDSVGFDHSFSFIYSQRPGTPAASLPDDVSLATKKKRLAELQDLISSQATAISNAMLGTTQSVLVDSLSKKDPLQLSGRTENNRVVNFSGDKRLIGEMVNTTITEVLPNSLRAILL